MENTIAVETIINEPVEKVWKTYTTPEDIMQWNHASDDWHSPRAENDLRRGGKFNFRMEAKDGSEGFDFTGTYDEVVPNKKIMYTMDGDDKRKASIEFEELGNSTHVKVVFDMEHENSAELQKSGWQAILDNFKKYTEKN